VWAGEETVIDGVLHVKNGTEPSQGVETLQLQEQWRTGGEDDDIFFGVVSRTMADDEGNVYLLDSQLSEVKVFSPTGEFLKSLSREGDGPGEVRNPNDMVFMPDGTLGLVQQFPGKIIKVDLDGNPAGDFTPGGLDPTQGGFVALADARCVGDHLVLGGLNITFDQAAGTQTRSSYVASFTEDGAEKVRYEEFDYTWDFNNLTLSETEILYLWRRWGVSADGKVLVPPHRNKYFIRVYDPDGNLNRVIEKEYTSWKRDGSEPSWAETVMAAIQRQIPFESKTNIEETEPDISSIHTDAAGDIWVLSSRGNREQPEGIFATYDVFDPAGHFTKQVQIACDGDGVRDGLFFLADGRIVLITGFTDAVLSQLGGGGNGTEDETEEEPAPMEIICYAVR
jgi:hypothetical protein